MNGETLLISNTISLEDLISPFRGNVEVKIGIHEKEINRFSKILVYDAVQYLPFWYNYLKNKGFNFRYHIVIYFDSNKKKNNLVVSHVGLLFLYRKNLNISKLINKVRTPHKYCKYCGKTLKDWGGKKHLMHPEGSLISDVWKHLNISENDVINKEIPEKIIPFIQKVFGGLEIIKGFRKVFRSENIFSEINKINSLPTKYLNKLIQGDILDVLKNFPSNSIDMIFIDPPYNINKNYREYTDYREDYVDWVISWLEECFRVLKPGKSLFLLNIPLWQHEILPKILEKYYLQDWIVWDNPAEPKGKLIPAHYSILWLSKTKEVFVNEINERQDHLDFCLRQNCRRKRALEGVKDKIEVRNVRWDIHRIKHRFKRLDHPTQLPPKLLEFLIKLTTNEGDIVLDPMMGVGTTPYVARKLNRNYIGIDISNYYVKLAELRLKGLINFEKLSNISKKTSYTKKEIQLKVGKFFLKEGYIPSLEEFCKRYNYNIEEVKNVFPSWSEATKYAKIIADTLQNVKM